MQGKGPFLLYLGAIITLVVCISYFGWTRTWSAVFVPTYSPPFGDMRIIQGAVISAKQGLNPQISNPNDPWRNLLNYPLIWVKIGQAVNLPNESRFIQFCSLMILCFVGICTYILYRFPSFKLLACLLSTATLLGIERGNTDLIMYSLVFLFALMVPKKLSPVPILAATALKLYPVFGLGVLFVKRQFNLFFPSFIVVLAIFIYLGNELAVIRSNTPVFFYRSYGFPSLAAYFSSHNLPSWMFVGLAAVVCSTIFVTAHCLRKMEGIPRHQEAFEFDLFLAGASIYIGTFIFSSNWDYRLMFLTFCVPFLEARRFPFGGLLVILIIAALNEWVLHPLLGRAGLAISWFAKIGVFIALSAYLAVLVLAIFEPASKPVQGLSES